MGVVLALVTSSAATALPHSVVSDSETVEHPVLKSVCSLPVSSSLFFALLLLSFLFFSLRFSSASSSLTLGSPNPNLKFSTFVWSLVAPL